MNTTYHSSSLSYLSELPPPSLTRSPSTEVAIDVLGTLAVQGVFFWLPCAFYMSLPILAPSFSRRHKLQSDERQPTSAELRECLRGVLVNQCISTVLHLVTDIMSVRAGRSLGLDWNFPSIFEVVVQILIATAIRDFIFYYVHRMLHHPLLYSRVHKYHHQFAAPVALASQYAHPVEHIVAGMLPVVVAMSIQRAHALTYWIWVAIQLLETTTLHSGYDFLGRAVATHEEHHLRFTVNYGSVGLMDWIMGTRDVDKPRTKSKII